MLKSVYNFIDDGFNPELVKDSLFAGVLEIPRIEAPEKIIIPPSLTPYSKRKYVDSYDTAICEYEHDYRFADLIYSSKSNNELINYMAFISPDCSLYRDMPLCLQITNTYFNRAVGSYMQSKGMYVITNVRWGDERSYTTNEFPERFAFLGAPKNSIVSIGTYGCIRGKENKYHFKAGLDAMLQELTPKVVLVYGSMPDDIFGDYYSSTHFVRYDDWTSSKRRSRNGNR